MPLAGSRWLACLAVIPVLALTACAGDTLPATHVKARSAVLQAHGKTTGKPATWWWEYGTSRDAVAAGQGTELCTVGAGAPGRCGPAEADQDVSLSVSVSGLQPNTRYFFRACGQDVGGQETCASIKSFKTSGGDAVVARVEEPGGDRLDVLEPAGVPNQIEVTHDGAELVVRDKRAGAGGSTFTAGAGCRVEASASGLDDTVRCAAEGIDLVRAQLGGGNDSFSGSAGLLPFEVHGGEGTDRLFGAEGGDSFIGGSGSDDFFANGGADSIFAKDGTVDGTIDCGGGTDRVEADRSDPVAPSAGNCETVVR